MKEYIVRCEDNKFTIKGEIVRCKDCNRFDSKRANFVDGYGYCEQYEVTDKDSHYCSYGEHKEKHQLSGETSTNWGVSEDGKTSWFAEEVVAPKEMTLEEWQEIDREIRGDAESATTTDYIREMRKYIDKDMVLEYIIFGVVGKDITCGELTRAIDSIPAIEVSEDCISREDAIEAIADIEVINHDQLNIREGAVFMLEQLPPVNQKQITGKLESAETATSDGEESTMGQPNSKLDCISRQQAVEAVTNTIREKFSLADWYEQLVETGLEIESLIKELPPVTPTERTGEWIDREQCQVDEDAYDVALCSNCKAEITLECPNDNYCPNCGAKMGGDTE